MSSSLSFHPTAFFPRRRRLALLLLILPLLGGNFYLMRKVNDPTSFSESSSSSASVSWSSSLSEMAMYLPSFTNYYSMNKDDQNKQKQPPEDVIICPEVNRLVDTSATDAIIILASYSSKENKPLPTIDVIDAVIANVSSSFLSPKAHPLPPHNPSLPSSLFSTPIFITIDGLPKSFYFHNPGQNLFPNAEIMEGYSFQLFRKYLIFPQVHILPAFINLGMAASMEKVLNLVECYYPKVEILYYLDYYYDDYSNQSDNVTDIVEDVNDDAIIRVRNSTNVTISPYDQLYASIQYAMPSESISLGNNATKSTISGTQQVIQQPGQQKVQNIQKPKPISIPTPYGKVPVNTALLLSSSWIPSHPSTRMITAVINSTTNLLGLPPFAPLLLTIDNIPRQWYNTKKNNNNNITYNYERLADLEEYTNRLFQKYLLPSSNSLHRKIHILPSLKHMHIAGSVMKGLQLLEVHYPTAEYLYYLQHDFCFIQPIDHATLVDIFSKYYPEKVNYVRFPYYSKYKSHSHKRGRLPPICGNETHIIHHLSRSVTVDGTMKTNRDTIGNEMTPKKNNDNNNKNDNKNEISSNNNENSTIAPLATTLYPSGHYSDNNHFVRLSWYKQMIGSVGMEHLRRPPEFYLKGLVQTMCQQGLFAGLYFYDGIVLKHLDGRGTDVF